MRCEADFRSTADLLSQLSRLRRRAAQPRRSLSRTPWPDLWFPLKADHRRASFFLGSLHGDFGGRDVRYSFAFLPHRSEDPLLLLYHGDSMEGSSFHLPRDFFSTLHDAIANPPL
jgi:hypothetical protein